MVGAGKRPRMATTQARRAYKVQIRRPMSPPFERHGLDTSTTATRHYRPCYTARGGPCIKSTSWNVHMPWTTVKAELTHWSSTREKD